MIVKGGHATYGQDIGILMLDTKFPRLVGDIGNAHTFPFPVRYKVVKGASPRRVVEYGDITLLKPFIEAARQFEAEGVKAITTSCGFLALFQQELSASVNIPVFSSSLLLLPFLYRIFGEKGIAGVLTARAASLSERHFAACGAGQVPYAIGGMDDCQGFSNIFLEKGDPSKCPELDPSIIEEEICSVAQDLVEDNPGIRFIVLECTNMPPFREAIANQIGKPIFDIVTLTKFVYSGLITDWRI